MSTDVNQRATLVSGADNYDASRGELLPFSGLVSVALPTQSESEHKNTHVADGARTASVSQGIINAIHRIFVSAFTINQTEVY